MKVKNNPMLYYGCLYYGCLYYGCDEKLNRTVAIPDLKRPQRYPRCKIVSGVMSVTLLLLALILSAVPLAAQEPPPITYERYDTEISVRDDGTMLIREIQQIRFDDVFESAFAEIPNDLVTNIGDVQLYEGDLRYREGSDGAGGFTMYRDGNVTVVEWSFTPTTPGDVRTFVLEYVVDGGLWVYPDEQIVEWRAVPAERSGIEVDESTVSVTVPPSIDAEGLQFTAYGPDYDATATGNQVRFTALEPLPDGLAFQVQVGMPPTATSATIQPWQAAEDAANLDYRFRRFDAELTLNDDGTMQVEERHQLSVDAGSMVEGSRAIPLYLIDNIDGVTLVEWGQTFTESNSPCDYCFQVHTTSRRSDWVVYDERSGRPDLYENRAGAVNIVWQFPPLVRGESTTFTLRYTVHGVIQQLADEQRLNWTVVFADRSVPVDAAAVQIDLPAGISSSDVTVSGGTKSALDENTIRLEAPTAIEAGRPWAIYLSLPVDALAAPKPAWQLEMENVIEQAANAATLRARARLGLGVLGILLAILGPLAVYLLWYTRGRDLPIPAIADYLAEPPSELPPAIVAYLLDEEPSTNGALASIFHLATFGLLSVRFSDTIALKRLHDEDLSAGEELTTPEGYTVQIPGHLALLFNTLKSELPLEQEVSLNQIYRPFHQLLPTIYEQMGTEATHFFDELPPVARRRWLVRGQWIVILALVAAVIFGIWYLGTIGWVAIWPALALVLTGATLIYVSRHMPRRTNVGVEEAHRWRAFRTYLRNLKKYGALEDAQRILDRYFAYAVAFDVEEVVLKQTEELGGHLPPWSHTPSWQPRRRPYRRGYGYPQQTGRPSTVPTTLPGSGSGPVLPPTSAPSLPSERPSLSGMSRQAGRALSDASRGLGSLLTQAAGPDTPFESILEGTQAASRTGGKVAKTTLEVLGEILAESSAGGGSGSYRSSGSSRGSWSSSRSRSSGGFSSRSSGRSSSSRRSGGGGRRGFR